MAFDLAFFEAFEEEAAALQRLLPPEVDAWFTDQTIQESRCRELPAKVISLRTQSKIPPLWAGELEAIITRSTGYDHLLRYCDEVGRAIPCAHLPLYCHRAVAEQAIMLVMVLLRKLPQQCQALARFTRDGLTGGEMQGCRMAVHGVGVIGEEVVRIGQALGMEVAGVDLVERLPDLLYQSKAEALKTAAVHLCAMNLTGENGGYFGDAEWGTIREGGLFVNVSRGELSPFGPLWRALEQGRLAGVGLDVFNEESNVAGWLRRTAYRETEELAFFRRLQGDIRVVMTPHNAFNTREAVERKAAQTVEQWLGWRATGRFSSPVPVGT